ncbi:hypothetical protein [Lactobacillus sp. Sy-1]|uniref:hypothetical protein n=1 Tax=Lactobacillus sp. Sy-1 TaxID=2109645 RepID=UPI001C5A719B|nr:hypothetical protein [Lactobacillus sp. Sy-1]MBW1606380.1 hypothetical protein [Lactobacillus sp. Sy-1]
MKTVRIKNYSFQYPEDKLMCFADTNNDRIAFICNDETTLVIDFIDCNLTFHPEQLIDIIEESENNYQIKTVD